MTHNDTKATIVQAIDAWDAIHGPLEWSDDQFTRLARAVFRAQVDTNAPYRAFCEKRGVDPDAIRTYRDIPAVPTDVFKHVRLTTCSGQSGDEPVRTFRTSGTTLGERGEHHFGTLDVYRASLVGPFERFCLPDGDRLDAGRLRMLIVAPSGSDTPESSLSFMLDELLERFGDADSGYFVGRGDEDGGELEMRFDELRQALDQAEADGVPTMLLGTAFGFTEFFDACEHTWKLARGSRVMETGGFKGKTRDVSREELYGMFDARLGVSQALCVSEYSMTELSSQAYSDNLFFALENAAQHGAGQTGTGHHVEPAQGTSQQRLGVLQTPPWARVEIVDPLTFEPIEDPGVAGLIRWYDLANTESVVAVQTSDLGVVVEGGGFRLLGRAPQAELRGCSLTIEEIVTANS